MMKQEENTILKLLQQRTPPAILILDDQKNPLFFNQEAMDILQGIKRDESAASDNGNTIPIPAEISTLYDKIQRSSQSFHNSEHEGSHLHKLTLISTPRGNYCCRGFFLSNHNGSSKSHKGFRIIILIEKVSKHRSNADFEEFKKKFALTDRQMDIIKRLVNGETNKEIANTLCICEDTVKGHLKHIMERLEVSTRTEIITMLHSL